MNDIVIIIPAYNPDNKMLSFLEDLNQNGYKKIIIVNDGSRKDTEHFFDEASGMYGCKVVVHSINLGQGRAYKSAFNYYLKESKKGGVV